MIVSDSVFVVPLVLLSVLVYIPFVIWLIVMCEIQYRVTIPSHRHRRRRYKSLTILLFIACRRRILAIFHSRRSVVNVDVIVFVFVCVFVHHYRRRRHPFIMHLYRNDYAVDTRSCVRFLGKERVLGKNTGHV